MVPISAADGWSPGSTLCQRPTKGEDCTTRIHMDMTAPGGALKRLFRGLWCVLGIIRGEGGTEVEIGGGEMMVFLDRKVRR